MKAIVLLLMAVIQGHAQNVELALPCYPKVCKLTLPAITDSEGNSTLDVVKPADLAGFITRVDAAIMIAEAIKQVSQKPKCPVPLVTLKGAANFVVGENWTVENPCVLRHQVDDPPWGGTGGTVWSERRLTNSLSFTVALDKPCTLWFYVFRGNVEVAGSCVTTLPPQSWNRLNVPPLGSFFLGHAYVYGGKVRELLQPEQPQLPPATWDYAAK